MTQEKKQLLLQDLCARLPYGVKLRYVEDLVVKKESHIITLNNIYLEHILNGDADIKPYLRPMSSMTEEEQNECINLIDIILSPSSESDKISKIIDCLHENIQLMDWLNKKHFDYRGLIGKGLALVAPSGLYNSKNLIMTQEEKELETLTKEE